MERRYWTELEDIIFRAKYSTVDTDELCRILKRTSRAVYSRARLLGLRKDQTVLSTNGKRLCQSQRSVATRFQKGNTPANKGKKMSPEVYARCSVTMFRKGHRPENHREVGSERVKVDGYIEIKVAEPNKWRLKHRVIWEQANGPIPKGYNIQFKDGDKQNVCLENLYIISRAEQIFKQNSIYAKYPEDLRKVIRVKATLKRQITMYNKKHNEQ